MVRFFTIIRLFLLFVVVLATFSSTVYSNQLGDGTPELRDRALEYGLQNIKSKPRLTAPTTTIGKTEIFWAYDYSPFAGYYQLTATCQDIGSNSYFFTEDAYVNDVAISKYDPNIMYVAVNGGVFKSTDGGESWVSITPLTGTSAFPEQYSAGESPAEQHKGKVYTVFIPNGVKKDTLYVGTINGIFRTLDGGTTWAAFKTGLPVKDGESGNAAFARKKFIPECYDMVPIPTNNDTFYIVTDDGVYRKEGTRFKKRCNGLPKGVDPTYFNGTVIWDDTKINSMAITGNTGSTMYVATQYDGIFKSTNSGDYWLPLSGSPVTMLGITGLPVLDAATYEGAVCDSVCIKTKRNLVIDLLTKDEATKTDTVYVTAKIGSNTVEWYCIPWAGKGEDTLKYLVTIDATNRVSGTNPSDYSKIPLTAFTAKTSKTLVVAIADTTPSGELLLGGRFISVYDDTSKARWEAYVASGKGNLEGKKLILLKSANLFAGKYGEKDYLKIKSLAGFSALTSKQITVLKLSAKDENTVYASTTGKVMKTTNGGTSWTDLTGLPSEDDIYFVEIDPSNSNIIYVGTSNHGIYKSTDAGATWSATSASGYNLIATTLSFSGNNLYAGVRISNKKIGVKAPAYKGEPLGGLIKSTDGGTNWITKNKGLSHRLVSLADISSLKTAFDDTIYSKTKTWLGDFPNIDNDSKIYVLLLDIPDKWYYQACNGKCAPVYGFFNPVNELNPADSVYTYNPYRYSNYKEMIYIDIDPIAVDPKDKTGDGYFPFNSIATRKAMGRELAQMVLWKNDADETTWLNAGLAMFNDFRLGYIKPNETIILPIQNSLTTWADMDPITGDYDYSYALMLYLYEKYLPDSTGAKSIKAISTDTANGIASIDRILSSAGITRKFKDIYPEFVVATHIDLYHPNFYGGIYGFKDAVVSRKTGASLIDWGYGGAADSPYKLTLTSPGAGKMPWGDRAWHAKGWNDQLNKTESPGLDSLWTFNGLDSEKYCVYIIKNRKVGVYDTSSRIFKMEIDPLTNEGYIKVDDFGEKLDPYKGIVMIVMNLIDADKSVSSSFVIGDAADLTPPSKTYFSILQNPIKENYLDLYFFTNQRIYVDGGASYLIALNNEGPAVELSNGKSLGNMTGFYMDDSRKEYVYHSEVILTSSAIPADGKIRVRLKGENLLGTNISAADSFAGKFIGPIGGNITSVDNRMLLVFPSGTLTKEALVTIFNVKSQSISDDGVASSHYGYIAPKSLSRTQVGDAYRIGPSGLKLSKPITIVLNYNEEDLNGINEDELGLYRRTSNGWVYVKSNVDKKGNTVHAEITMLGEYQIQAGPTHEPRLSLIPTSYGLSQNQPNPFNPETVISYQLPKAGNVSLKIYNSVGQLVRTLVNDYKEAGYYSVKWDGRDDNLHNLPSGIYMYKIEMGSFTSVKRMVLLK